MNANRRCLLGLACLLGLTLPARAQDTPPAPQGEDPKPAPAPAPPGEKPKDEKPKDEQQGPPPVPPESNPGGAQEAQATAQPPGAETAPSASSAAPAHPAVVWPLDATAIEQHLRAIAGSHPDLARLEVVGKSAGGREILVLWIGPGGAANATRPALLLADFQGQSSPGAEASLALAWELVESYERDESLRALLAGATLVLAPELDPDVRASAAPRAVFFDRNFPAGWQPETVRAGAGRVSLALPETLAAARFLSGVRPVALVLGFGAPAPAAAPYAGAALPPADKAVLAALAAALELAGAPSLVPWYEHASGGGGFLDFAYQARGIYPLLVPVPSAEELAGAGLPAFTQALSARVRRALAVLPRVTLTQEGLEHLAGDTWQLDVRLQNSGLVPTESALGREREPGAEIVLRIEGAKLVATAQKPAIEASFTQPSFQSRSPLAGGVLAGGEGRWLRLLVEAKSGSEVRVTASSPWSGSALLAVTLP